MRFDGGGGQRKLRGGSEGGSSTADHSEQAVVCVVDGEGECTERLGPLLKGVVRRERVVRRGVGGR